MSGLNSAETNAPNGVIRFLRGGTIGAPSIVFLHGGVPGVTPYCAGAHVWGRALGLFLDKDVIAFDLPGAGGSTAMPEKPTIDEIGSLILSAFDDLQVGQCDVVGHDFGGAVGVWLALNAAERLRSLSIVASGASAPSIGEEIDPLQTCPHPLWNRYSQRWVFDRLSYSDLHITDDLLDACVSGAGGAAHEKARRLALEEPRWHLDSLVRNRAKLWEACRNGALKVPIQLLWSAHDPLVSVEAGYVLFKTIAENQRVAHFDLINAAGSFPFRERPDEFHHFISSFQEGVAAQMQVDGAR